MTRSVRRLLAAWVLVAVAMAATPAGAQHGAAAAGSRQSLRAERARTFDALVEIFRRHYWDPAYRDWQEWSDEYREAALNAPDRESFDVVLGRMVRSLGDDHSAWMGQIAYFHDGPLPEQGPRFGFQGRLLWGEGVVIERVFPDSAASRAGLRRGDVIVAVDGVSVSAPGGAQGAWRLLGEASDQERVVLEVRRATTRLTLAVAPRPFELERAREMPQAEMLDGRLGYIYIPSFNRGDVAAEVHRLVDELKAEGARELVLDLRGNPGGRLAELGLALGAFVDGTWVRAASRGTVAWEGLYATDGRTATAWLEDPEGRVLMSQHLSDPATFDGPLAVLVDRNNSSAGEIAALVLQVERDALVIGEATEGNVEAVRGFDLPDGSIVMVAIAVLEASDGTSFTGGVVPDSTARESLRELAQGYDAPLAEAIRLLRRLPFTPNRYFGATGIAGN